MNAWELLSYLRQHEIQLWIEGDRLRLRAARGELSADLRSRISEHRTELLSLLREAHSAGAALPPLEPVPRADPLPLSFAQERLWVINRIEPGRPIYNSPAVLRLAGPLRIPVLVAALGEIVRRHEVLRTTFPEIRGEPVQRVSPAMPAELPFIDLGGLPLSIRERVQGELAAEEIRRPFALERGPLLRIRLIRLAPELHVLLFTLHHIVFDGWSTGVIVREVAALYEALSQGGPSPLSELAIQYGDFAAWQRRCLRGEALEHELSFWRERLAGATPVLALATDRRRPAVQSFRGTSLTRTVPAELAAALEGLSLSDRSTPFMTLLAAFQILLYRYTGQDDLSIGTPVAGRSRTELEGLIGLFVNTLVLRADLGGDPGFRELLAKVREDTLEAFAHQDLPLEKLVAEVRSDRSLSHNPLFQVLFALQNVPRPPLALSGLEIEAVEIDAGVVRFDLALALTRTQAGLSATLRYATDLFERATAERMLAHFRTLLEGIAADPERRISELPLLSPSERHQALVEWRGARTPDLGQGLVHEGFEEQARRRPEAVAAVFAGESLTCGELNRRANRLAWRLRRLGVGPESRVGICLERSLEMMMALLAVLKAGGAYVPLDPTHPPERLSWLWEDSGAVVLLARRGTVDLGVPPLRVVDPAEGFLEEPEENPVPAAGRDHLVYVLYTSGTTGRPKGVMVPQRGVVNHLRWRQAEYGLGESDCLVHKAPLGFDASVWELLWPLSAGARLIVARPGGHQDVSYLVDLVRSEGVTFLHAVPSLLRVLVEEPELRECTSLRRVTTGGEPLPREVRERFFTISAAELLHGYGPTEASIGVTYAPCERRSGRPTTLGRPIANVEIYLTDRELGPVPLGVAGELCIGGACLARGYLGRPELTAERFIPHPWSGEPGARLYRSGDLVRRRADGGLEFLGRTDHQVKVRGIRIEPAEIESVLSTHPGVREAVVLAREGRDGDRRLVAYVVDGEGVETEALRSYLSGQLPPHMVPSGFVVLDALPLMANGKVDRLALTRLEPVAREPEPAGPAGEGEELDPVREIVAGIWCEVLGRSRVGRHDSFFELGGHSLLATQVASRLRQAFGVEVPLRTVFEVPRLGDLAARLSSELLRQGAPPPAIEPVARGSELPLSFAQERLWFIEQLDPGRPVYHMPAVLRLEGRLDPAALSWSLSELVRRQESLRTRFVPVDGRPLQVVDPPSPVVPPVVDLSGLSEGLREAQARRLAEAEARRPFDLSLGPLLRVGLVRTGETEHLALLTMHHIVSDGWSTGVLVRELSALYGAAVQGLPSPLPELAVQYADFAVWQRAWLRGEVLERELGYWRERLAGVPPVLELPADRPRPAVRSLHGGRRPVELSGPASERVLALARQRGATLFMVLLAGFQALLHRYTGLEDLAIGTPIAGRNRLEIEGLIGFFVNTLVLRTAVPGTVSFSGLLERVREAALGAYSHQDVPYERVVEELQPERSLSHTPLFQVMFSLQGIPRPPLELPDLRLSAVSVESGMAKFDLTLALGPSNGRLAGSLQYATDLFDRVTVERLGRHLATLLEAASREPERPLPELALATEAERHQTLLEWNDTGRGASAWTVTGRFEEWVARTPDAPALAFEGEVLSYRELAERTDRLAARLRRRVAVAPEALIAVCLERSLAQIEAILAILRAGGAYVPIDPDLPPARIAFVLEDSGARAVITEERLRPLLPGDLPAIVPDAEREAPAGLPEVAGPGHMAYLIYTSGSTGRPKGVAVEHRQLASYLDGVLARMALPPGCSYATVSTLAADLGNTVIWAALATGGCLHVISRERLADGDAMGEYFARHGVDCLKIVPSHLAALLTSSQPASCLPRRLMVLGGESCRWELVDRIRALAPDCRVLNHYGPTETTVGVLTHEIGADDPGRLRQPNIPLGRPLQGTRIEILDRHGQGVPLGVPGELCVGGANVSRGYLGRPELTAARFVPDARAHLRDEWGARLYATGDLARRRPDSVIEFLGRVDHQVKIRGYRIELGEIESALSAHPDVRGAVVLARDVSPGDRRLVAFVASGVPESVLIAWLRERLPDAMIPSLFMALEILPLTPNGKVDRSALARLELREREPQGEEDEELDPVREIVAGIWCAVLGRSRVGRHDSFFELGGHSLLATQVASRLRQAFGVEVPLRTIFEVPRLEDLAARLSSELLRHGAMPPPIEPVARGPELPLSFAQERLWFIEQLDPGRPVYHMPAVLRLEGRLDPAALSRSLSELARRQESLRTRFVAVGGRPLQVIDLPSAVVPPVVDLSSLPEGLREAQARRLAKEEARRPFDLSLGPLLRAGLVRTGETEHLALLTMHHIVSDGWSTGVLVRELSALYGAAVRGLPSPLPELAVQYADFAVWQRAWLRGEVLERELGYWRERLAGVPPVLELPADRPRPAARSLHGGRRPVELSGPASERVLELARRRGATLFMVLLAGFKALLHRYTGLEDLVIGTPIAGRNRLEIEGLIGFFVNTLVLRTAVSGTVSFAGLLERVREAALGAYSHQDVPFERVVEELQPERSLSHTPLFQVMFGLQGTSRPTVEPLPDLTLSSDSVESGMAKFDLTLVLGPSDGRLAGSLQYATDLFDRVTVERLGRHLATLLEAASREPERPLSELALATEAERHQTLLEWNDTGQDLPSATTLHRLFEQRAEISPGAEAVVSELERLTYGELEERSNRLASHLGRSGVGRGDLVAVCAERSLEMVVGLLGVLKSGAAYLPLDPEYPADRLAFLLEDSGARLVLLQEHLAGALPELPVRTLRLDADWEEIAGASGSRPDGGAGPDDLAYVIYTSGSTGRPKGVQVPHRGVVNRLLWAQAAYPVEPGDRVLVKASFSFDFSVWEIFGSLLAGATAVLARPGGQRDSAYLARTIREQSITLVHFVPSMLQAFLAEEGLEDCTSLRFVFAGGEALTSETLERFHDRVPVPLRNQYGPTEASIDVMDWLCRQGDPPRRSVPIGRPIGNCAVYPVDPHLQAVPVGIPGELLLGGPAVSRGYLRRPGLTAERFLPDPFGGVAGARVYRTGDQVRWAPDGTLEFLGRIDHQVKVRGFRIELGEIEAALRAHPGVLEAAVLARQEGPGGARLVAYAVFDTEAGEPPSVRELRERLREDLPEFMLPAAFVPLERMPLTPSGKADRRALARIAPVGPAVPASLGGAPAALTPVQEILAGIWRDVLGLDGLPGAEAHFFELGGHSLLATQVISRVRQALGVDVPLRSLFEAPTIAGLAGVVERARRAGAGLAVPPLVPQPRDEAPPLSFAQERLWFVHRLLPESSHYNMPSAVCLEGTLDPALLARTLEAIIHRHEVLRTSFPALAGIPVQRIAPPAPFALPLVDLSCLPPERRLPEAGSLAAADARRPFDLTRGTALRATLVRLDGQDHAGLFTLHHIVSDGWSRGVFLRDLVAIYDAFREGRPSPLPPLAIQSADFAIWQRSWLRDEILEAQLSYWRRQLDLVPPLEMPLDRPRPSVQRFRAGRVPIHLPHALSEGLRRLAGSEGGTLYMVLLAGFAALVHRYTGQDDFALGSPIANRNHAEIEELIGFFVNSLVLRVRLAGDPVFRNLLGQVREVSLQAYAHQDLPFEKLVEELQPERSLSRNPLFQVVLALQNAPMASLELPGLTLSPLGPEGGATRFDLEIHLWDLPDGLRGMALFDRDLFDATTIARLVSHLERQLSTAVADPGRPLSELELLTGPERRQLLAEWNDTAVGFGPFAGVRQRFEAWVQETPDALAVAMGGEELSYRELDLRAGRLALHLRELGAGPEVVVGICLERSVDLIVAILAAVKTGGAYLPLDPAYPAQRLGFMLRDARALALVTCERLAPGLEGAARHLVRIDSDREAIAARSGGGSPDACLPAGLAYVIYTSGSTGRPKGVALTHAGLANLVSWHQRSYGVAPRDRATQLAGPAFDASVWEVWPYLTAGASLHLPDEIVRASPPDLLRWLAAEEVTFSFLPTPQAEACLRQPTPPGLALSAVLTGGDRLHRLLEEPPYRLVNHYGPTESTVVASCAPVAAADDQDPPIGRPIDNLRVHVADRHLRPVPIGVPGELLIAGVGLARGYLGQPGLSAQRFVPDPFGRTGGRLYRTGDLARWRGDGNLEFLGRIDHQIKLRGYRIELGEIESLLLEHPEVAAGAVLAREDAPGQQRLVAYVAPARKPAEVPAGEMGEEQVEEWRALYDETYELGRSTEDAAFNIVGWDSSYTREPIPAAEMREWVDRTVEEILALGPQRVLEIGVGTGLLLHRVAPSCALYLGTDFSRQAIDWLAERLRGSLPQVELAQRTAEDFSGIAPRSFDTVVLNSVVQYFPDADYLARVLAGAVEAVADGGAVYVGDVRSLPLLEAFHASVELFQATPALSLERLRQLAAAQRAAETELVIDPGFFFALQSRLARISAVEVRPKQGLADNELTRFRYQVVLRVGRETAAASGLPWLDWEREGWSLEAVRRRLAEGPEALALSGVPNVRVEQAVAAARALAETGEGEGPGTAGELRERLEQLVPAGVHPGDLLAAARESGYEAVLSWAQPGPEGRCDVLFHRPGERGRAGVAMPHPAVDGPWSRFANNPTLGKLSRRLAPALRSYLEERLPAHMVPSAFVLLDELPLTPNGKVNRRALPAPEAVRLQEGASTPARTPVEERLAAIFCEVLHLDRLGVEDDFFAAGGHSLLATQVISRIREAFEIELPLRSLFETPTVAGLALLVEAMRAEQGTSGAPPLRPVPRDGALPLSFSQERLWFLHRLDTRKLAYNEAAAFRMEGRLDTAALRWSLDEILRRHESLRTAFPEVDGWAVQRIHPPAPFELPAADLSGLSPAGRGEEARRLVRGQALRPFDLACGPLVRGLLLRLGETDHAVFFSFHHIVFDGWSTSVFVRELSALYGARLAGAPSPLPPLPIQYADFSSWQRQWLRGEVLESQLAYWRERLTGAATLSLPTDRPRSILTQAPCGLLSVVIPPALTQKLRGLSRSQGATLFMTLLAVFQTLLHRYTGQEDVVVGSPIANRNRGELESLIGFFVNMLVLRTDLSGDPSFGELLGRVRQVALGAYAHQDLPFEKLVEELRPDRDLWHTPLFQASFRLLNVPTSSLKLPGLSLLPFPSEARAAKFDLDLGLIEEAERLNGRLEYDAALFDGATIERLLGHLDRLLAGVVESPGTRLSELPLLTPAERSQVVVEWNDTGAVLGAGVRLHEMFEARARHAPEAVALVFEGEELRYGELNARANQLAHVLRRRGVGPGLRVGLCVERSPEMLVGLLGALKSGGAYVPLDPSYPQERLAFMLTDARVQVLLTQERLLTTVLAGIQPEEAAAAGVPGPPVLCLDTFAAEGLEEDPPPLGSVDDLAYVIYTSGSTGLPKGAMNSHRAICNRLLWMQEVDGLTAEDRVLQKTPFSFDVSVWELFWPLITGARLVLARPGGHQDPGYLALLIQREGVTTAHFVPSMLQVFLEARDIASCASLRRVICSGEALPAPLARRFFACYPQGAGGGAPALYNLYGPTEAAVEVTAWRYEPENALSSVPIGRPGTNTATHVLDAHLQPVPIGVPAELYLGGVQLARGYLDRPALTAERFVPDPFAGPGARLYRTGDQVRRLPGGEIVYLGRLDHQVKIRGVRIEPGEIEVALAGHPGVLEAAVVVWEDRRQEKRLAAFAVLRPGAEATAAELRPHLALSLPEAMIPSSFTFVATLPLTPSGKVDRRALATSASAVALSEGLKEEIVLPRDELELLLKNLWEEALDVRPIGVRSSFFALGGHSLLAVRLAALIRARLGFELPLAAFFQAPTVEAMAELLRRQGSFPPRSVLVEIGRGAAGRRPFFCVHPIGGNVLAYAELAQRLEPVPFYGLQSPGPEEEALGSIEAMAERYLAALRTVQPEGPYRLGGWSMGGVVAYEMAQQIVARGEQVELLALIDSPAHAVDVEPPPSDLELLARFAGDLARLSGLEIPVRDLAGATTAEALADLVARAEAAGVLPSGWDAPILGGLFDVFRSNSRALAAYRPPVSTCRLALFRAGARTESDPTLGWGRVAMGGVEVHELPGGHYSLLRGEGAGVLADQLGRLL